MSRLSVLPVLSVSLSLALALEACATRSALPDDAGFGAAPALPAPRPQTVPTVKIARAVGWPQGQTPVPAAGLAVGAFATGLDHPRWLYVLPNGDVLVAESKAPAKPKEKTGGLRGWIEGLVMSRAGSGDTPSADRISLLRDGDGDGTAETKTVFLSGLTSPFGMALIAERLYIANADAVVAVPYQTGQTRIDAAPVKVADLPAGRNHHWTKSLVASADGTKLYVGVGSNSNIGENGLDEEVDRAAILEIDAATGARRVFASGLRNPVGLAWNPQDGRLWTSVNERDALGDDLVPDYMTSVARGGFYGWPWSYYGTSVDERVQPARPDMVARAIKPDYALGSHTASLGLTFYAGTLLPQWRNGAIIGQHGSWNRNPPSGYKVIFVPFRDGRPDGPPQDVLTGFRNTKGEAMGRPVGVAVDGRGALLVADDVGDAVWRVTPAAR
ncbi:L-sorbosone dehydrogenase [Brevundimonas diminuta 3F5N]|uniref:L-sorbosone dehydrogenase n=1 Tax=Brevundimonas diminuta 3F5N TaxID=1255603 RepID=A0A1R4FWC2_BREDI|nr:sorbosone dehydrogenase family protein [Brevundimonas diminuta]SJM60042.1 L-sorbosone dehydrogenase [Brevundimonas diminuta 3F5N]